VWHRRGYIPDAVCDGHHVLTRGKEEGYIYIYIYIYIYRALLIFLWKPTIFWPRGERQVGFYNLSLLVVLCICVFDIKKVLYLNTSVAGYYTI
jgi:hypothetical protein